jgi:hypothetical protein
MPEQVRLWRVAEGGRLEECRRSPLDLESRLEDWLARDISVLGPDLLLVGRQVETASGGYIDLLCLDDDGDLVVVELKRDKTPREITAQVLDYASWVKGLSGDEVREIAGRLLGPGDALEQAFERRFGKPLPDTLNEGHRMLVVGSAIDDSTERIIRYLSETYDVGINAATFNHFEVDAGEFIARVFLMDPPSEGEAPSRVPRGKRLPPLTLDELEAAARDNGVEDLYRTFLDRLSALLQHHTTRSSVAFTANFAGSRRAVFSLLPRESSRERGLHFQVYVNRMAQLLGRTADQVTGLLPPDRAEWSYVHDGDPDYSGYCGFFKTTQDIDRFVAGLGAPGP